MYFCQLGFNDNKFAEYYSNATFSYDYYTGCQCDSHLCQSHNLQMHKQIKRKLSRLKHYNDMN